MDLDQYEDAIQEGRAPDDAPREGWFCFKHCVSPSTLKHNIDTLNEKITDMQDRVDDEDGKNRNISKDFTGTIFVSFAKTSHVLKVI